METITMHIGQAGVAASSSLWQLYCIEHGIDYNGTFKANAKQTLSSGFHNFFVENGNKANPRALLVDMDSSSIDNALIGWGKEFFSYDNTVSSCRDASSNYAVARYSREGRSTISNAISKIRKMTESASCLQGFIVQHALGGGTGSGITSTLLEKISYLFPKKVTIQFSIFPSPKLSLTILESFNAILSATPRPCEMCSCLVSNIAMCNALQEGKINHSFGYSEINSLWNYCLGTTTSNMRHGGDLNARLRDIVTCLVPFPKARFTFLSYSPIRLQTPYVKLDSPKEVIGLSFDKKSLLLDCDIKKGRYLAANVCVQGFSSPPTIAQMLTSLRGSNILNFAPWCPSGFKMGLCSRPSGQIPGASFIPQKITACCLHSNTAITKNWKELLNNYNTMLKRKAFTHWYLAEGMEEEEFRLAAEEVEEMIRCVKSFET